MRKIFTLVLTAVLLCGLICGCSIVGDIAGNVVDAAAKELENQLKATLEEHKVEVVELKTAFGRLNGEDEKKVQLFCAALIKSESDTAAENCAKAMGAVFGTAGWTVQTGSKVEHEALVHKSVVYDHSDFSGGKYYTVYVYVDSLTGDLLKGQN